MAMRYFLLMIAVVLVGCGKDSRPAENTDKHVGNKKEGGANPSSKETKKGATSTLKSTQRTMMGYVNVVHGKRQVFCQLIGTNQYHPEFTQSKIAAGRFLSEVEETSKANACVISLELAQKLSPEHNLLMEKVIVHGYESAQVFQVIGILEQHVDTEKLSQPNVGTDHQIDAIRMYIPSSTFKSLFRDLPNKKPKEEGGEPTDPDPAL